MKSIFVYRSYTTYLLDALSARSENRRGIRKQLAQAISSQPAHVTQVLKGDSHLTLEQALATSQFLIHDRDETNFFRLLVEYERAATENFKAFLEKELEIVSHEGLNNLKKHTGLDSTMTDHDRAIFFSNWLYSAVLVISDIPNYDNPSTIAETLKVPEIHVNKVFEFLDRAGLIVLKDGRITSKTPLQENPNPISARNSINWRLKAIDSMGSREKTDFHPTATFTVSKSDFLRIKESLTNTLKEVHTIQGKSKKEVLVCLNLDLFKV